MIKILIAAHGEFPAGLKSSAEIIMGKQENLYTLNAYTDDISVEKNLQDFLNIVDKENDKAIILTDLFGGSVNQKILANINLDEVFLISGVNLALLLELLMLDEKSATNEKLREIIILSRSQIMLVKDVIDTEVKDDFDF